MLLWSTIKSIPNCSNTVCVHVIFFPQSMYVYISTECASLYVITLNNPSGLHIYSSNTFQTALEIIKVVNSIWAYDFFSLRICYTPKKHLILTRLVIALANGPKVFRCSNLTHIYAQTIQKVNVEHVGNGKHAKCQT